MVKFETIPDLPVALYQANCSLYKCKQGKNETSKNYLKRFEREVLGLTRLGGHFGDDATLVHFEMEEQSDARIDRAQYKPGNDIYDGYITAAVERYKAACYLESSDDILDLHSDSPSKTYSVLDEDGNVVAAPSVRVRALQSCDYITLSGRLTASGVCGGMCRRFAWAAMLTWNGWYCLVCFQAKRLQVTKMNCSLYYSGGGVVENLQRIDIFTMMHL